MSGGGLSSRGKCPRCGGEGVLLGNPVIAVGKTRGLRVEVFVCRNCGLVFYEKYEETGS